MDNTSSYIMLIGGLIIIGLLVWILVEQKKKKSESYAGTSYCSGAIDDGVLDQNLINNMMKTKCEPCAKGSFLTAYESPRGLKYMCRSNKGQCPSLCKDACGGTEKSCYYPCVSEICPYGLPS